ncbi:MAG TPA: hypothetical protein DD435_15030, partial [Cyanobacteria bacterium UBA8530]|nr:hypothetical protein [Cyanobacteria bacterium UBA8530]
YAFSKLKSAHYRIQYLSEAVKDPVGKIIGPNEVASWQTNDLDLGGSGAVLPPFDVSYNGLTYPDTDKKQTPSSDAPLPFFWSTHLQAKKYRVKLWDTSNGNVINPSGKAKWTSDWTENPTVAYSGNPGIGNYGWEVEIDAGDAGLGKSRVRSVQF